MDDLRGADRGEVSILATTIFQPSVMIKFSRPTGGGPGSMSGARQCPGARHLIQPAVTGAGLWAPEDELSNGAFGLTTNEDWAREVHAVRARAVYWESVLSSITCTASSTASPCRPASVRSRKVPAGEDVERVHERYHDRKPEHNQIETRRQAGEYVSSLKAVEERWLPRLGLVPEAAQNLKKAVCDQEGRVQEVGPLRLLVAEAASAKTRRPRRAALTRLQ
jgi:hypothetical protein